MKDIGSLAASLLRFSLYIVISLCVVTMVFHYENHKGLYNKYDELLNLYENETVCKGVSDETQKEIYNLKGSIEALTDPAVNYSVNKDLTEYLVYIGLSLWGLSLLNYFREKI